MVDEALIALRRNMSRRATVRGAGRIDTWEYPETALREAITNALVHRDYPFALTGNRGHPDSYGDITMNHPASGTSVGKACLPWRLS